MTNSAKVAVSMCFLFLIGCEIAFLFMTVSGAEYKVGEIEKGNWARYRYYSDFQVRNYTDPEEYYIIGTKEEERYMKIEVESAFDVDVSFSVTMYSKDGEEINSIHKSGNVRTGEGVEFYMIAGYLGAGDRITNNEDAPKINKTLRCVYANASRVINQAEFEKSGEKEDSGFQIRWDAKTGLLCSMMARVNNYQMYENYMIVDMLYAETEILETDLWNPERGGGTDWLVPAGGLAILGSLAVVVFFVKRHTRRAQRKRRK